MARSGLGANTYLPPGERTLGPADWEAAAAAAPMV